MLLQEELCYLKEIFKDGQVGVADTRAEFGGSSDCGRSCGSARLGEEECEVWVGLGEGDNAHRELADLFTCCFIDTPLRVLNVALRATGLGGFLWPRGCKEASESSLLVLCLEGESRTLAPDIWEVATLDTEVGVSVVFGAESVRSVPKAPSGSFSVTGVRTGLDGMGE